MPDPMSKNTTDRPVGDILHAIVTNVREIVRSEVRLVEAEWQQEVRKAAQAAGPLLAGSVLAIYGIGFLLLTVVFALATTMPLWLATLVMFLLASAIASALMLIGRSRMKRVTAKPEKAIESVRENVEWAKIQTR